MAADLSYSDYARRMGGDKARRAYTSFRDSMDQHYSQLDAALKPAPLPDPANPYARGAASPLGGLATQAPLRIPVSLPQRAKGGRVGRVRVRGIG
jgi:hypothetical protein